MRQISLSEILRSARHRRGLSQSCLAHSAGVSLPTVQNIETGRANPAWSTVGALLKALHLTLDIQDQEPNWPLFRLLGCPLAGDAQTGAPTREVLLGALLSLNGAILGITRASREAKALRAWLTAIHDHYPSLWRSVPQKVRSWMTKGDDVSIKLRRIALQSLAAYL